MTDTLGIVVATAASLSVDCIGDRCTQRRDPGLYSRRAYDQCRTCAGRKSWDRRWRI